MGCARAATLAALLLAGCLSDPSSLLPGARGPTSGAAPPPPPPASGTLQVTYVDVGQGDAAVWRLPGGGTVVYDCGPAAPDAARNPVVRRLQEIGLAPGARLDALVASHGHADHVGGCEEVLESYRVAHVYEGWYDGTDRPATYEGFLDQLAAEGAVVHTLRDTPALEGEDVIRGGGPIALPPDAGASAAIAWPRIFAPSTWERIGEESLVVRLAHGGVTFCFQGDIERAQEEAILQAGGELGCAVYLAGHHGSREAGSAAWLARMKPQVAVVSFGDNSYGHPTAEALCRIQQAGARLYLTHRLGDVVVESDGARVTVAPDRPETVDYCAAGASYWTIEGGAPETGALHVDAAVSDAAPCQHATVEVVVTVRDAMGAPVPGANVTATWRYRSTSPVEQATTGADGTARIARGIGAASAGHEVRVEVEASAGGEQASTLARFTPRTC